MNVNPAKLVCAIAATILAYFVLGSDGSQQMHQFLLAGVVAFLGVEMLI